MGKTKAVEINYGEVEKCIGQLNTLASKVKNYSIKWPEQGENRGSTVSQLVDASKQIDMMKEELSLLIQNSASYLRSRLDSVENKDVVEATKITVNVRNRAKGNTKALGSQISF